MRKVAAMVWDGSADLNEAQHSDEMTEAKLKRTKPVSEPRKRQKVKYNRRTIELHPDIEAMLDHMQSELRLRSHTEVMQKAIQLLAVVLGDEESGRRKIYIERKDGKLQELLII